MKNFVSIFSIILFLLVLWQCNPMFERQEEMTAPVSPVKSHLEKEKRIAAEHLRDCSDNIDRRIRGIDEQISKAEPKLKYSLNEFRKKLVREKLKVDRSLKEIEQSTSDTWQAINKKTGKILTDVKIETQKIEERIEDLTN